MNESIVKSLLMLLEKHFKQPVKPVSEYCKALNTWAEIIVDKAEEAKKSGDRGKSYAENLPYVLLDIRKSNLLWRLIYGGEELRKEKCPEHKGKWSGCFGECKYNCGLTGWLPNVEENKTEPYSDLSVVDIIETQIPFSVEDLRYWLESTGWKLIDPSVNGREFASFWQKGEFKLLHPLEMPESIYSLAEIMKISCRQIILYVNSFNNLDGDSY